MATSTDTWTTITVEMDSDLVDDPEIDVAGDEPPRELREAVHGSIRETIGHLIDGETVVWSEHDGHGPDYTLEFRRGIPEMPAGDGHWLPPYRTREKFEGADGGDDGLLQAVPDGWSHECERNDVFGFYRLERGDAR